MAIKKKILAIPHIGTAFGHFYRMAILLEDFINEYDIFITIPESYVDYCEKFLNPNIVIIPRQTHSSINGASGIIDVDGYKLLLTENENIYHTIEPDLIIGDPGIQASILATKFSKPWIGIMHGCYLPFPYSMAFSEQNSALLKSIWDSLNYQLDKLICLGTNGAFTSWQDIQRTGKVIIPNRISNEPSSIGEYVDLNNISSSAWGTHTEVDLLITCCSAGTVSPTSTFLSNITELSKGNVFVAGIRPGDGQSKVIYLGNNIDYKSLVNEDTVVISHGGHGTLQAIGKAKNVFLIPSDLDQLYNSIIASTINGWHLIFDKNWFEVIDSGLLFKREIHWENLVIQSTNNGIEIKGLEIYKKEQDLIEFNAV